MIMIALLALFILMFYRDWTRYETGKLAFFRPILSGAVVFLLGVYVFYFYLWMPMQISQFYNGGYGITYREVSYNATGSRVEKDTVFWDWTDNRVGTYFAVMQAENALSTWLFTPAMIFAGLYAIWILSAPILNQRADKLLEGKKDDFKEDEEF